MGKPSDDDESGESQLRGEALNGVARKPSAKKRDPDAVLHLDDEEDTLYTDDLDLEDSPSLVNTTDGNIR
jgi:hypothetical protein